METTLWGAFLAAIAATAVGELPCLVRTTAVCARTGHGWAVFAGTMLATAALMGLGSGLGAYLRGHAPEALLRWAAPVLFLFIAVLFLLEAAGKNPHH